MRRMKSQTHSPARLTSSRCAESALTDGIAMNSLSSCCQVSSMGRDSTQVVRAAAEPSCLVVGIEQTARLEREAAAADARVEPSADRLERLDAHVELLAPAAREPLPVALRRRASLGKGVERATDPLERDAGGLARPHESHAAERDCGIAALVAVGSVSGDQALPLVEAERRLGDAAPVRELADRKFVRHLT